VHRDDTGTSLDVDQLRLFKSQDANYVHSKLAAETHVTRRRSSRSSCALLCAMTSPRLLPLFSRFFGLHYGRKLSG
jgi:hypothetical protein